MSEDLEAVRCALAATRSTLARAEAERDRLREALRAVLRALRGAGDDADKADAAYGVAQDALAPEAAKEGGR